MGILQQLYIWVLNPIYGFSKRITEKARNIILFCASLCMTFQFFMYTAWYGLGIEYGYAQLFMINTFLLGIMIVCSMNKPLTKVKWSPWIWIPWFLCSILIIISGIHHNITGALMMFAFLMLLVFPALYFVWNNRGDYHVLYAIVCKAIITMMIIYFLFHLATSPLNGETAYYGISINPNSNGFLGVAGAMAAFYLISIEKKGKWIYAVTLGMSFTLTYISTSRASIIALAFVTLVFIICYLRSVGERRSTLIKTLTGLVIIGLVTGASLSGYRYILINVTPDISTYISGQIVLESYAVDEAESSEESDSGSVLKEKFTREGDLDTISSGRTVIWRHYIDELNMIGNERGDRGLYIAEKDYYFSAHNSYLEIAYRSGIPAGICYAIIALYAAVYSFRFIFGKKLFDYRLMIIPMAVMAFGVLSNLERALYPVEKAHIFLFFISLAPMFMGMSRNGEEYINDPSDEKR